MKKLLILVCGLFLCFSPAHSQNGKKNAKADSTYWFMSYITTLQAKKHITIGSDSISVGCMVITARNILFKVPTGTTQNQIWKNPPTSDAICYRIATFPTDEDVYTSREYDYIEVDPAQPKPTDSTEWDIEYIWLGKLGDINGQGKMTFSVYDDGHFYLAGAEKHLMEVNTYEGTVKAVITNFNIHKKQ